MDNRRFGDLDHLHLWIHHYAQQQLSQRPTTTAKAIQRGNCSRSIRAFNHKTPCADRLLKVLYNLNNCTCNYCVLLNLSKPSPVSPLL